jgi:peptidoglycan hydrolase CwlO-like protein
VICDVRILDGCLLCSTRMRRPGRFRANVERSIGVAEHHACTGLTRLNVTRIIAVACISALGLLPAVSAHAVTTNDRIAATSRAIDAAAQRWFGAQADAARIDASIADVQHEIAIAQATMDHTRRLATARAVVIYQNSDVGLASVLGDNALDSARRAQLVDDADAGGDAAIAQLTAAVDNLKTEQRSLDAQRARQNKILRGVATERQTLDRELGAVRSQARQEAAVALASARDQAARDRAAARVHEIASANAANALAAPTGPPVFTTGVAPSPSPPANDGRVSPHHDDPFLVCTRARESDGIYTVVSPSGYYGAYQFLPSTWDSTAVHEGRLDLVGVLPSRASQFDQDETAWALYQWQGKGPWGGRC